VIGLEVAHLVAAERRGDVGLEPAAADDNESIYSVRSPFLEVARQVVHAFAFAGVQRAARQDGVLNPTDLGVAVSLAAVTCVGIVGGPVGIGVFAESGTGALPVSARAKRRAGGGAGGLGVCPADVGPGQGVRATAGAALLIARNVVIRVEIETRDLLGGSRAARLVGVYPAITNGHPCVGEVLVHDAVAVVVDTAAVIIEGIFRCRRYGGAGDAPSIGGAGQNGGAAADAYARLAATQLSAEGAVHIERLGEVLVYAPVAVVICAVASIALVAELEERPTKAAVPPSAVADGPPAALDTTALDSDVFAVPCGVRETREAGV